MLGLYVYAGVMVYRYGSVATDYGWEAHRRGDAWYVSAVDPHGAAAGRVVVDDRVLAVDDDTRIALVGPNLKTIPPDSTYTVRLVRGGGEQQLTLYAPLKRDYRRLARTFSYLMLSVAFFLLALLMGSLKPEERITRLACIALFASALFFLQRAAPSLEAAWLVSDSRIFPTRSALTVFLLTGAITPLHWVLAYHFYYSFPQGVARTRFWTGIKHLLYAWGGIFFVAFRATDLARLQGEDVLIAFRAHYDQIFKFQPFVFNLFQFCAAVAIFAVIIRNYHTVTAVDQRRRVKWLVYASVAGISPLAFSEAAGLLWRATGSNDPYIDNILFTFLWVSNLLTLIIPVVSCYVILKHHVFDINVVIRRGVQYLLAKNALRLLLTLPAIALLLTVLANPNRTVAEIVFRNSIYFYLLFIVAAALSLHFRRRLSDWIDRKFFREVYDQEKILHALIEDVKKLDSMSEMSRRVSLEVERALHPERVYLFYRQREHRDLSLGYSSGGTSQQLHIPENFRLLPFMEDQGCAQIFPFPPKNNLPPAEKDWLDRLGTRLIVPLAGSDGRLAGLFLLGEKKAEVPYTARDRELLEALADQIAIVYENVRLKESIAHERRIKHEVLARVDQQQINLLKECPACGACFDSAASACTADGSELQLSLPVERTIEARYRLERLLGRGGMGAVYEATDLRLQRQVAIKILSGSMFGNVQALRRFEREAQAAARLRHPNIVTVHDYGVLSTEGAYLVMELVAGETLRARLKRERQLTPATAADIFDQLLEGVKAAHQAGVVHRDLKSENIFLVGTESRQTHVYVLDFGLAKLTQTIAPDVESHSPIASVTTPGAVLGTFGYMSPEQLTGGTVDERSDLFSIGVMVVEVITGRRPFGGTTYHDLLTNILQGSYHLPNDTRLVQRLDEILQCCLAKASSARFASAAAMQAELIPALRRCPPFVGLGRPAPEAETAILP
ncbi:MAG TPA: protein kinase [Blastocatellia bacterium]|nr:protein kinase [Blastocatellia bacterium]